MVNHNPKVKFHDRMVAGLRMVATYEPTAKVFNEKMGTENSVYILNYLKAQGWCTHEKHGYKITPEGIRVMKEALGGKRLIRENGGVVQ